MQSERKKSKPNQTPTKFGKVEMETINIHQAKTNLSRLIERVQQGEEIVISKSGKPVAKLTGLGHQPKPRTLGLLKGKFKISADFDEPLSEDVLRAFEGRAE